jgi:hypothetical protein
VRRRAALVAAALALLVPHQPALAAAPGRRAAVGTTGGAYRVTCGAAGCAVDVAATAEAAARAARPMIEAALAARPAGAGAGGTAVRGPGVTGPGVTEAVAAFRDQFAAALRQALPGLAPGAVPPPASPYLCGTYLQPRYDKHHQNLFFYTQSYYTDLVATDSLTCNPTDFSVGRVLVCATWAFVVGLPAFMVGFGRAYPIDGSATDLCIYPLTPSATGLLPGSIGSVRGVIGETAWAVIGPDSTSLDD